MWYVHIYTQYVIWFYIWTSTFVCVCAPVYLYVQVRVLKTEHANVIYDYMKTNILLNESWMPTFQDDYHIITIAQQRHGCDVTVSKVRQTWKWKPWKDSMKRAPNPSKTLMAFSLKWGKKKKHSDNLHKAFRISSLQLKR